MALDFPASPTTGQTYTPAGANGAVWKWDGAKWVAGGVTAGGGGSVTSVTAGTGITATPNPITVTGTLALAVPVAPTNGGTGLATYAQGDIIYASAANTLTSLAKDAGTTRFLSNTGATNNPAWAQVPLTTGVSGVLPVANGGTGASVASAAPWVETGGDTMSGLLTLSGPPTAALHAATKAYVDSGPTANNVGRNLIHNPLFNVAQRGAGPFTVNSVHTADRWPLGFSGGTMTVNVAAVSDADRTSIGDEAAANNLSVAVVGGSGAGDETFMEHRLEGVRRTAGKTVTLSFYAKASVASQKIGSFLYQSFGTGGSPSGIVIIAGQAVTISTTYARYSMTFTIPSAAGKTFGTNNNDFLDLRLGLSAGATSGANYGGIGVQSATFQIWGVQLEIGSTMTPLEKPDPQQDLANCQRFYQTGSMQVYTYSPVASGVWGATILPFPVTMRATPTLTQNWTSQAGGTGSMSAPGPGSYQVYMNATATGGVNGSGTFTASADL